MHDVNENENCWLLLFVESSRAKDTMSDWIITHDDWINGLSLLTESSLTVSSAEVWIS
jgi:hypothetical protein